MSIYMITESWLWINSASLLGCTLQACKPCTGPASRKPGVSSRDINGLVDGGILHVWIKVLEWNPTLCDWCWTRWQQSWLLGRGPGNWGQVGSLDTGETSKRAQPSWPSWELSRRKSSDLKVRTITSWDRGQACRKVNHGSRCRWSGHWSSRGCTESKRQAIISGLGDLTIPS